MENLSIWNPRYAIMCFQNIYHIGDTKSGQELEVFFLNYAARVITTVAVIELC